MDRGCQRRWAHFCRASLAHGLARGRWRRVKVPIGASECPNILPRPVYPPSRPLPSTKRAKKVVPLAHRTPLPAHRRSIFGSKTPAPQVPLEPVNVNSTRQVRTYTRPRRSRGPFVRAGTPHGATPPRVFGKKYLNIRLIRFPAPRATTGAAGLGAARDSRHGEDGQGGRCRGRIQVQAKEEQGHEGCRCRPGFQLRGVGPKIHGWRRRNPF